jgi:hypothetical protein
VTREALIVSAFFILSVGTEGAEQEIKKTKRETGIWVV